MTKGGRKKQCRPTIKRKRGKILEETWPAAPERKNREIRNAFGGTDQKHEARQTHKRRGRGHPGVSRSTEMGRNWKNKRDADTKDVRESVRDEKRVA